MSTSKRWKLPAAIATIVGPVLAVPTASTAAESGPERPDTDVLYCYTEALTTEQVEAGETSQVDCYPVPTSLPQAGGHQPASVVLAQHYSVAGGAGAVLTVTGTTCSGSSISFGSGHSWNNRIRSTRNQACGNSKHFVNADLSGDHQLVSGPALTNMNSTLAGRVSSIGYG